MLTPYLLGFHSSLSYILWTFPSSNLENLIFGIQFSGCTGLSYQSDPCSPILVLSCVGCRLPMTSSFSLRLSPRPLYIQCPPSSPCSSSRPSPHLRPPARPSRVPCRPFGLTGAGAGGHDNKSRPSVDEAQKAQCIIMRMDGGFEEETFPDQTAQPELDL